MSPLVKLGLDVVVEVAKRIPEIATFVGRAIEAAKDTDDEPLAAYVEENLAGDGYSADMSRKIRERRGG